MNEIILFDEDIEIKKAQALVRSRYKLSPLPLKLITTLIGAVQDSDSSDQEYCVRVKEFVNLQGLKGNDYYNKLKDACYEIMSKPIIIGTKGEKDFLMCNWASSCKYVNSEGLIKFKISSELLPYIKELKTNYLKYDLVNILPLRSDYSIRIYEWLKDEFNKNARYGKEAEMVLEVDFIRDRLEVPKSYNFDKLKKRILNKSKKDLEEYCNIKFTWEIANKTGRAISHIKFKIYPNKKNLQENKTLPFYLDTFLSYVNYLKPLYRGKNTYFISFNTDIGDGSDIYYFGINNDGYVFAMPDKGGISKKVSMQKAEIVLNASYLCSLYSEIYRDFISNKTDLWKLKEDGNDQYYCGIVMQEIAQIIKEHDPRIKPIC